MPMFNSRLAIFGWIIAVLVVINVAGMIWSNWGLVTLNYKGAPLQEVLDSLQKQAGIQVKTNLDPATPVTIRVIKKTFPEALDLLAGAIPGDVDVNWRLAYVMAPAREDIAKFFDTWVSGTRPEDWRWIGRGGGGGNFGGMGGGSVLDDAEEYLDPRANAWNVQPVDSSELQVLLQQGNILTDALFVVPVSWNPKIENLPSASVVQKLAFKVASAVNGQVEETFLLMGNQRPVAENTDQAPRPQRPQGSGFQFPQSPQADAWREQRTQERLAKLPADKRIEAQAEIDQRKTMAAEMRKLTPEQRAAKFQEMMNDPAMQEKMEENQAKRDSKNTPEQRLKRFKRYVDRKKELRK